MSKQNNRWYGIYGIQFIWHGTWSDPEILYHRYLINSHLVEDSMVAMYRDEGGNDEDEEAFAKWMYANRERVREECKYIINNRKDFGEYVRYCG